jgi:mannose-6-phosphate isomerase-like protein (cupin superfamily)
MASSTVICNLTATADQLRMGERPDAPEALFHDDMSAEIVTFASKNELETAPAGRDILYVVISGSGVIESGGTDVDFTAGDVLFAPAGVGRRFAQLSRRFKAWKISLRPS